MRFRCDLTLLLAAVFLGDAVSEQQLASAAEAATTPPRAQAPSTPQPGVKPPPGTAPATAQDAEDAALFAAPTRLDRIGRIVAPVMINGQGPFRFIVDTGASHSTLSPALVARLGLTIPAGSTLEVNGVTGTAQVPAVKIQQLQAGALRIDDTDFPVVWAPLMAGADGILGAAGLRAQRLMVDFEHNRVVISRADHLGTPRGFMRIPASRVSGGLVVVRAIVGGVRVRAVIDTGSERSLGNLALQDALKRRRFATTKRTADVYGATSAVVPGDAQRAPTIAIDDLRIADVTLVYGDFHIFKVWNMENKPALIIGMDVLGTVQSLVIDFQRPSVFIGGSRISIGDDSDPVHSFEQPTPWMPRY